MEAYVVQVPEEYLLLPRSFDSVLLLESQRMGLTPVSERLCLGYCSVYRVLVLALLFNITDEGLESAICRKFSTVSFRRRQSSITTHHMLSINHPKVWSTPNSHFVGL
jgi:hypothetical protein